MPAVPFDTLALARRLEAAGFAAEQAQDTAAALAEVMSDPAATKQDIRDLRSDLEILKRELTIRVGGMVVVATGVLLAAKFFG